MGIVRKSLEKQGMIGVRWDMILTERILGAILAAYNEGCRLSVFVELNTHAN
jgi:hypothetical protein